jgi:hypothetical protein
LGGGELSIFLYIDPYDHQWFAVSMTPPTKYAIVDQGGHTFEKLLLPLKGISVEKSNTGNLYYKYYNIQTKTWRLTKNDDFAVE